MTNREYFNKLDDSALATLLVDKYCECCVFNREACCCGSCAIGIIEWLKEEREGEKDNDR